jgi:hypothetical protein
MPTTPTPPPAPRIMWAHPDRLEPHRELLAFRKHNFAAGTDGIEPLPVLVLPCADLKTAQQRLKLERMTREQKVEMAAKAIANVDANDRATYTEMAAAVLAVLAEGGK